jgi:hypothetical protein
MADQPIRTLTNDQSDATRGPSEAQAPTESTPGNGRRFCERSVAAISNIFTEHQAEASSSSATPTKKCASCGTPESDPEKPLKPCSKCQTVRYCSRDCQKKDWKVHKKTCASAAQIYAQTADLKPASAPRVPKKEGHRGGLQKWQFDT